MLNNAFRFPRLGETIGNRFRSGSKTKAIRNIRCGTGNPAKKKWPRHSLVLPVVHINASKKGAVNTFKSCLDPNRSLSSLVDIVNQAEVKQRASEEATATLVNSAEAETILELAKLKGALLFGEFELSAGGISPYYFDGRLITLDPEGAYHISKALLPILKKCDAEAIAGPTLGADPIVSAVALMSYQDGNPIPGLIVRKEAKEHGGKRAIEGPLPEGGRVAVVDDTCTSGASLFLAIDAVEAAGCKVVKVICILDRREGGSDEIRRRGYDFVALLEANERGEIGPTGA